MPSLNPLSNLSTLDPDTGHVTEIVKNVLRDRSSSNAVLVDSLIDHLHREFGDHIYQGPFRWFAIPYGGTICRAHLLHFSPKDYFPDLALQRGHHRVLSPHGHGVLR